MYTYYLHELREHDGVATPALNHWQEDQGKNIPVSTKTGSQRHRHITAMVPCKMVFLNWWLPISAFDAFQVTLSELLACFRRDFGPNPTRSIRVA